ncbi:hypothetical protein R1flu_024039 [Riccia fluitans]|uniref:PROP1-like PPR domain-containing protein n=1 Tax=Riccia fluitans TaxID=41844 RepID=A0ABD1XTR1_9MARC
MKDFENSSVKAVGVSQDDELRFRCFARNLRGSFYGGDPEESSSKCRLFIPSEVICCTHGAVSFRYSPLLYTAAVPDFEFEMRYMMFSKTTAAVSSASPLNSGKSQNEKLETGAAPHRRGPDTRRSAWHRSPSTTAFDDVRVPVLQAEYADSSSDGSCSAPPVRAPSASPANVPFRAAERGKAQFVWRRPAPVSPESRKESRENSSITQRLKAQSSYRPSEKLLDPRGSSETASPTSSPAPPRISNRFIYRPPARGASSSSSPSDKQVECSEPPTTRNSPSVLTSGKTPTSQSRLARRPETPQSAVASSQTSSSFASSQPPVIHSSSEVRKVRIRCSKCGSKSHVGKACPNDRKCARCSDPGNNQPCATVVIRTRMMKDCRDSGDLPKLRDLLISLKTDGHQPTVHSYSILLSFMVSKGQMQEALKVWKTMDEDGVAADTICYNTLLNGWCSVGNLDEATAVLKEMKARKFQLSTSTYNTLMKGFGLAGRAAEAMKLLQQMTLEDTAKPNRQTYNILVNAWAQMKDIDQARRVLQLMRNAGFTPDVVTYNTIAKAYAELRRSFEAERVISEMKDVYIRPNERTYGIVINSYCETGRPEEGLSLLDRMRADGVGCNLPIYNILIKGFAQSCRPDKMEKVLELMGASGVKPDVQSFSIVMNVWCSSGLVEEARAVFERMQNDYELRPDVTAYTILAKGYVRARRPAEAENLISEMTSQGLRPNVFTFTTVISGWCNVGSMEDAYRVFKYMETCGVRPNSNTASTLIWGFSESKQPQRAEEVLEAMKTRGFETDRKCLELVAEAWRSVGLPAEARRVLRGEKSTDTMADESSLKTRFDSMLAERESLLDSNIHTRLNKEPALADTHSSLSPHHIASNVKVKEKSSYTAVNSLEERSIRAKVPLVHPRKGVQIMTANDKFMLRINKVKCTSLGLQISNRLNCRGLGNVGVNVGTWHSTRTIPRRTPWNSLVIF